MQRSEGHFQCGLVEFIGFEVVSEFFVDMLASKNALHFLYLL